MSAMSNIIRNIDSNEKQEISMEINEHLKSMLGNEKYRIEMAIRLTKNDQAAMNLLNIRERTYYRKLKAHGIVNRINQKRKEKIL